MKIFSVLLLCLFLSDHTFAQSQIASCHDPKGYAFFPFIDPVPKSKSGWTDDAITGGVATLTKIGKGDYDLLFVDSTKRVISSKQDGGLVRLIRANQKEIAVLVLYPNIVEVYTFWKTNDGQLQYSIIQSKGADNPIYKTSEMVGKCDFINFNAIN